jgi:hypothetical protein
MQIEPEFSTCPFGPVSTEVALDSDRKTLGGIALRAFESAHIITRCGWFDLGQPHGVAALRARQDSDFSTAVKWIGMGGWHVMLALDQAGAQYSQSPVTADKGR